MFPKLYEHSNKREKFLYSTENMMLSIPWGNLILFCIFSLSLALTLHLFSLFHFFLIHRSQNPHISFIDLSLSLSDNGFRRKINWAAVVSWLQQWCWPVHIVGLVQFAIMIIGSHFMYLKHVHERLISIENGVCLKERNA